MARRWIITALVAAVLVVGGALVAREIKDDDSSSVERAPSTSRATTTSVAPSTTAAPTTTAPPTTTTAPTSTTGPPGPCGVVAAPIRAAVDAAVSGAAQNADVAVCRLAASDPSWGAVHLVAKPGAQFAELTVIVRGGGGAWSVVAQGGVDAGCGEAPQQVIVDLGQFCAGTGGGGVQ